MLSDISASLSRSIENSCSDASLFTELGNQAEEANSDDSHVDNDGTLKNHFDSSSVCHRNGCTPVIFSRHPTASVIDVEHVCEDIISSLLDKKVDISNVDSITCGLQALSGVQVNILKKPRHSCDAVIFKLSLKDCNHTLLVKIHRDSFNCARNNYQPCLIESLNNSNVTTTVRRAFVLNSESKRYRVCVYDYVEGVTLTKALREYQITTEKALELMEEVVSALYQLNVITVCFDCSDVILTPTQKLKITDWNKLKYVTDMTKVNFQAELKKTKSLLRTVMVRRWFKLL